MNFVVVFGNGHFHNVVSTFINVIKLDVEKDVVSALSNVGYINVYLFHMHFGLATARFWLDF